MNKETYEAMMKERQEYHERILSLYNKLSYRDRLLFYFVVNFLADNPVRERVAE